MNQTKMKFMQNAPVFVFATAICFAFFVVLTSIIMVVRGDKSGLFFIALILGGIATVWRRITPARQFYRQCLLVYTGRVRYWQIKGYVMGKIAVLVLICGIFLSGCGESGPPHKCPHVANSKVSDIRHIVAGIGIGTTHSSQVIFENGYHITVRDQKTYDLRIGQLCHIWDCNQHGKSFRAAVNGQ